MLHYVWLTPVHHTMWYAHSNKGILIQIKVHATEIKGIQVGQFRMCKTVSQPEIHICFLVFSCAGQAARPASHLRCINSSPSVPVGHAAWHVARARRVVPQVPVVAFHHHLVCLLSNHSVCRVPSDAETTLWQHSKVRTA